MQSFQENNCRLCSKTFCCAKCREHHEEIFHKVNIDCEICIYGRMTIKNASVSLLNHIKNTHWPLHCVFCKKVFSSFDELVPHDKCSVNKIENMKVQGTPKTPETPYVENKEQSPMITPFYKSNMPKNLQINPNIAFTSTPLVRKEEAREDESDDDKITPINTSDMKSIFKSNLKLTGSSNFNESKKSDRRVTFSETPSVSDGYKKTKYLPLEKKILNNLDSTSDKSNESEANSDTSFEENNEIFKTVPNISNINEDKENADSIICKNYDSEASLLWKTALTNADPDSPKIDDGAVNVSNHFNLSIEINVFNEIHKTNEEASITDSSLNSDRSLEKSSSLWTSMTNIVKSVISNMSVSGRASVSVKRTHPDFDSTSSDSPGPRYKRMKLTELKCRRPIRALSPLCLIRQSRSPKYVDKSTQTESDMWM